MFKKLFIICSMICCGLGAELPDNFAIEMPLFKGNKSFFTIKDKSDIGYVVRNCNSSSKTIEYITWTFENGFEAKAKRGPSDKDNRVVFEIFDAEQNLLGTVKENWHNCYLAPSFELYTANNELIAKAGHDCLLHTLNLTDPADEQHVLVSVTTGFTTFTYSVEILDLQWKSEVDPRLLLLFTTLAIDAPYMHTAWYIGE